MRRREFITILSGAAAMWPVAALAQQAERMRRIGILLATTADDVEFQAWVGAFLQELALKGWTIGRNVRIDTRWAGARADDIRRHAAELAALAPDVILAHGASTVGALLQATRTVPIVFPILSDPVAAGHVDSMARPGGDATGFTVRQSAQREVAGTTQANRAKREASGGVRDPRRGSGTASLLSSRPRHLTQGGGQPDQHRRRRGDRTGRHGICALARTPALSCPRARQRSLIAIDRRAGGPPQTARGLLRRFFRRRRPDFLRA